MMRMLADFQTVEDDDRIVLSADDVDDAMFVLPSAGDRVLLDDEDGHICEAVLESVGDGLWTFVVDWATWAQKDGVSTVAARGWRPLSGPGFVAHPQYAS